MTPSFAPKSALDAHYLAIVDSSEDAIISKDLNGVVTSWNPGATSIFGYSAEEMIGQPLLRLFPPERVHEEATILQKIMDGQKVEHFETIRLRKDGQQISISATISPIRDQQGKIVGASKIARDITSKHHYESIFSLSPDGFVTFDHRHCITHVSKAVETLTQLPAKHLIGQSLATFVDRLNQGNSVATQIDGPEFLLALAKNDDACVLQRPSIANQHARVLSLRARSAEEGLVSLIVCLRDISHESHVEELKTAFLSAAAHELRTPMTSIGGFIELLMLKGDAIQGAQRQHLLELIHKQAQLIKTIVDDMLDLRQLEAGIGQLHWGRVDVCKLSRQVLDAWPLPAGRQQPALTVLADSPFILGDRSYLQRALLNLLSNSAKYSDPDRAIALTIDSDPEDECILRLAIRDEGIGMTPEQLARYGERFFRADASGAVPGAGLGASLVKQIVELHRGTLEVISQPGCGTTVTIRLPRLSDAA